MVYLRLTTRYRCETPLLRFAVRIVTSGMGWGVGAGDWGGGARRDSESVVPLEETSNTFKDLFGLLLFSVSFTVI